MYLSVCELILSSKLLGMLVKELGIEQTAIFETLDKIQYVQYDINGIKVKMLPKEFNQRQQQIIDMLNLKFPAYV